jgi:hypothetical protein
MLRQPLVLIALVNVLILGIASVAVIDLRRLQTPGGTALRWLQAAVFGSCDDYLTYSVADRPDPRSRDQLCQDLRASTQQARKQALSIGLALRRVAPVEAGGDQVDIALTREGVTTTVVMHLVRREGRWRVLRDELTCRSVGCA